MLGEVGESVEAEPGGAADRVAGQAGQSILDDVPACGVAHDIAVPGAAEGVDVAVRDPPAAEVDDADGRLTGVERAAGRDLSGGVREAGPARSW